MMARSALFSGLPLRRSAASLVLAPPCRGADARGPETAEPSARGRGQAGPAGKFPPNSCIGCSWATSRCSAAIPRLPRAPISRRRATSGMPRLARRATEIALAARQRALALDAAHALGRARSRGGAPETGHRRAGGGAAGGGDLAARTSRPSSSARWRRPRRRDRGWARHSCSSTGHWPPSRTRPRR